MKKRIKKEVEIKIRIEKDLPKDIYTDMSIKMADALANGRFEEYKNTLDEDVQIVLYGKNTIYGKREVTAYWKDWRKRYVETKEVTLFDVVMSRYYSHACLRVNVYMLVMFRIVDGRIATMLSVSTHLTNGYSDDNMLNYPYSYDRIKLCLTPVDEPFDANGELIDTSNHIPCLTCGRNASDLQWYISEHPRWNKRKGVGVASVCPNCGRVVEFKEGITTEPSVNEDAEEAFPVVNSDYSDKGNAYSDFAEKLYSKVELEQLYKKSDSEISPNSKMAAGSVFVRHLKSMLTDVKVEDGFDFRLTLPTYEGIGDITHFDIVDQHGNIAEKIKDHLHVEPAEMGVWQLYLLESLYTVLPTVWHGGYEERKYIFKETDIDGIIPLRFHDLSSLREQNALLPAVKMILHTDKLAYLSVCCCYWSRWQGLVKETAYYIIADGQIKENKEKKRLFDFHCGIVY